ncbi:MAG: isoprenylcysteine carboxylmethyltransferase family protein [Pirellulaceae bacterium]|nr:isoprenylcysteine carboxylmethyltransferase family protein [Pirellulaceae bacterium]
MKSTSFITRIAVLAYGSACYTMFLGVFLYAIGFIGNFGTPTTLDAPGQGSLVVALLVNCLLLTVFAVQHTVMARPTFKQWWNKFVPKPIERSTYVLFTNVAMIMMFWFWQPMGGIVWNLENSMARTVVYVLFACGWLTVLYSTLLIDHFDLFGLRQVWLYFTGTPYTELEFRTPSLYRYVRHPLYVGWLAVFWIAPTMTFAHLLFAAITTAYILVAIQFEERNLVELLPGYADYRKRVPMLIPSVIRTSDPSTPTSVENK